MFKIVDFESAYNAILGRPSLTKFMAATHHSYQSTKIPSPKGVISMQGNNSTALNCDRKSLEFVDQLPLIDPNDAVNPNKATKAERPKAIPEPNEKVKQVPLTSNDQSKTMQIG